MTADALRALLLPAFLLLAFAAIREERAAVLLRLLRAELVLTAATLLLAVLGAAPGSRRTSLLAAALATAAEAGFLPRLLGPDPVMEAPVRPLSGRLFLVAAGLVLTGWTFAALAAAGAALPSGGERREIATVLSALVVSLLGLLGPSEPRALLCRLGTVGTSVLLLAATASGAPADAVVASLSLVPVILSATLLLPRLLVAEDADAQGEDGA